MQKQFNKRVYTIHTFRTAVDDAVAHLGDLRAAARSGRVSRQFAERIMLAVTQVNGCRYCQYGHSRAALRAGVTPQEIEQLAAGELGEMPPEEIVALMFAQHYAETEGHPDPETWQTLVATYGPETARDVLAYIRMIMIGNLSGNTLDALLSRLRGRPSAESTLWQELGVLLGSVVIIPGAFVRRRLPAFR